MSSCPPSPAGRLARRGFAPLLLVLSLLVPAAFAAKPAPKPVGPDGRAIYRVVRMERLGPVDLLELVSLGIDLERNGRGEWIAYLSPEEMDKLEGLGFTWTELPDPGLVALEREKSQGPLAEGTRDSYHDYDALTAELQEIADAHPEITRLVSAGKSVDGRDLWWMKITDNPDQEEDEPGFKYISTMHGDEPVGTENCLKLIHLLVDNYGTDPRITRIVDEVETWIMPLMNPDGNARHQRYNADGVDLNRDFPDRIDDPVNTTEGRAAETRHIMNWQFAHSTILSANFHTGAVVVNYPYDNNEDHANVYTATPDDDIVRDLSLDYSEDNSPMYNSSSFPQGITNGADWYTISGGMQDWNYTWEGDIEVTVELNDDKWPPESELPRLWDENRESMLSYLERALTGVRGIVTDEETGAPVAATLRIAGRDIDFFTDPEVGDFHRPMPAGTFDLVVSAPGYETKTVTFTVTDPRAEAVRVDVQLRPRPTDLEHRGHRIVSDGNGDGWIDAGESGQVAVTLGNEGATAHGITGVLVPLTSYATTANTVGWPDLAPGEEAESLPPHFNVRAADDAPPGHVMAFTVDWDTTDGVSGETDAFFIPVGPPIHEIDESTDVPQDIDDNATVESTLDVAKDERIDEVNVRVDITHTYIGDLTVTLVAPDGTEVRLHDRSGGSTDDIHTWYDTETEPVDDLSVLNGKSSAGTWKLRVTDHAGGDTGTLDAWKLELYTRPWEDPVAEVRLRDVTKTADGKVRLEWWPVGTADSYRVHRSADPSAAENFSDVTAEDDDPADTVFVDGSSGSFACWIVTGEGHTGEGAWGHYGR